MTMTKWNAFELKIARERRAAQQTAPYREGANDGPRRPEIYSGFEEYPDLPKSFSGGTCQAGDLERRLREREIRARGCAGEMGEGRSAAREGTVIGQCDE
jgi:hypothetical protein